MSADNYYYVGKNEETGKYEVSHRFASVYYRDEITEPPREYHSLTGTFKGWSVNGDKGPFWPTVDDAIKSSPIREDWVEEPPKPCSTHDTLEEAIMQAHRYVYEDQIVEYGVVVGVHLD